MHFAAGWVAPGHARRNPSGADAPCQPRLASTQAWPFSARNPVAPGHARRNPSGADAPCQPRLASTQAGPSPHAIWQRRAMPGEIPPAPTRLANQGWHLPSVALRRTQSGSAGPCPAKSLRRRRALPTKVGIYPSVALRRTQSGSAGPCPAESLRRRRALPTKVGIYPSRALAARNPVAPGHARRNPSTQAGHPPHAIR